MRTENNNEEVSRAAHGPAVLSARSEPETVELNREFQPTRPAEVVADVKDLTSTITDVKLQFANIPLEIPMENIGGSTWRAQLTPRQLEMLAVSGRTTQYAANVVAKNQEGKTAMTRNPVQVAVKAPDLAGKRNSEGPPSG
jgi:hypothetical protein